MAAQLWYTKREVIGKGKAAMGKTLSFGKGKGNISHNNREFVTPNVARDRIKDNIIYKQERIEQAYEKCFGKAIEDYNAKQRRADRKKSVPAYMDEIKKNQANRNGEKLFYEQVVGIGDMVDSGILTQPEEAEKCRKILDTYMYQWEKRNPNLYVFNAVLHMDEQTPHLHIDYFPVGTGYKQGMSARNSLTKAFENMGVDSAKTKNDNATIHWQKRERAYLTELAKEQEIEIDVIGEKREDLSLPEYRIAKQKIEELEQECDMMQYYTGQLQELCDNLQLNISEMQSDLASLEERKKLLEVQVGDLGNRSEHLSAEIKEKEKEVDQISVNYWKDRAEAAEGELRNGMSMESLQLEYLGLLEQKKEYAGQLTSLEIDRKFEKGRNRQEPFRFSLQMKPLSETERKIHTIKESLQALEQRIHTIQKLPSFAQNLDRLARKLGYHRER